MTRIKLVLSIALTLLATSAFAEQHSQQGLLQSIPDGPVEVRIGKRHVTLEYCPDNTCDVIRFATSAPRRKGLDLAAAYLFYGSKYEYLKDWQQDATLGKSIDARLRQHGHCHCMKLQGKALAICEWTASRRAIGLDVLYVRFDEGKKLLETVPWQRVFE